MTSLPFKIQGRMLVAKGFKRPIPRAKDQGVDRFCRWLMEFGQKWMQDHPEPEDRDEMLAFLLTVERMISDR